MFAKLLVPLLISIVAFAFGLAGRVHRRGTRLITTVAPSGLSADENDTLNLRELLKVTLYWACCLYALAWFREIRSAWQHHPLITVLLVSMIGVLISLVAPKTVQRES